jgi:DNA-binding MarR family transcriptional regulator
MAELTQTERVAFARLRALLELLPSELDRQLASTGLTSFEHTLLEALNDAQLHRLRLTALAAKTNATLPRLSRVVTGLERKGLVTRAACEEDGRATNAILTAAGAAAFVASQPLHDGAVRDLVMDGLNDDDVSNLAALTFSMLSRLDPERRLAVTASDAEADADAVCAADPAA